MLPSEIIDLPERLCASPSWSYPPGGGFIARWSILDDGEPILCSRKFIIAPDAPEPVRHYQVEAEWLAFVAQLKSDGVL